MLDRVLGARAVRWRGVDRRVYGDLAEEVYSGLAWPLDTICGPGLISLGSLQYQHKGPSRQDGGTHTGGHKGAITGAHEFACAHTRGSRAATAR